jgi:Kef-type K+ transport system membrane component KefB
MTSIVLTKFLIILCLLFFLPKVLYRLKKIPPAITEVMLGIALGIIFPAFFFMDDVIRVLGTVGIITIFVSAGMDTDLVHISKKKRIFAESLLIQILMIVAVSLLLIYVANLSLQISVIISLALLTPSAGFIFALLTHSDERRETRKIIQSTVVSLEILSLLLLLVFLNLDNVILIVTGIAVITAIIFLLPLILRWLYENMFKKIIGAEFAFIFVVALLSAFITEWIGVHFIIGAFVAGIVSKQFLEKIKFDRMINRSKQRTITEGFGFFAQVFAPFYFFSIGLMFTLDILSYKSVAYAVAAFIVIMALRFLASLAHHKIRKQRIKIPSNISLIILPTLIFTFVIADLLNTNFQIEKEIFGAILIYGLLASIIPLLFLRKNPQRFSRRTSSRIVKMEGRTNTLKLVKTKKI